MNNSGIAYIDKLRNDICDQISAVITESTISKVVRDNLKRGHIENRRSMRFQDYYFQTVENQKYFVDTKGFFKQFKQKYSLQFVDNSFLNKIERKKPEIISCINEDRISSLYFDTFRKAPIKYKEAIQLKELGSFFSKLLHTYKPNDYCALDIPIRKYFHLEKESFFIAFCILSESYKVWAADNRSLIDRIRKEFRNTDIDNRIPHDKISDLKLLDLIFWSKANGQKNGKVSH